ncbi:endolytic transglycosylase MltG [Eubacterium ruminantium]|uniref:endolytic transglycosylase MltG n=1 Tax=Eubacterium ruminantium TaxID=42322 RepID=UPI00156A2E66|nr:endolytic transglycosylase MltG [Eubacterium ruminantium]
MKARRITVKIVKWIICIVVSLMLFGMVKSYVKDVYKEYNDEYTSTKTVDGKDVVVEIPVGASDSDIATILKQKGLIKYKTAFTRRLSNSEYSGKLHNGKFTLNTGMNTLDMMKVMAAEEEIAGPVQKLVVPEGFSVDQIAERCEEQDICSASDFIKAVKSVTSSDFPLLEEIPASSGIRYRLEGFLFPATYDIYEDTTAESLVKEMLQTFLYHFDDDKKAKAEEMGLSVYEVMIKASMVERECKVDSERKTIAGVFNNRIEEGMLLQIDPTVLYPLTEGKYDKETVTYDDLEIDSPYNTYKYEGLPVGPICNPGDACIDAVLDPEEHDYLYYHTSDKNDGSHVFNRTLEEHENSMSGDGDE